MPRGPVPSPSPTTDVISVPTASFQKMQSGFRAKVSGTQLPVQNACDVESLQNVRMHWLGHPAGRCGDAHIRKEANHPQGVGSGGDMGGDMGGDVTLYLE
eukprot:gene24674-biopygen4432